MKDLETRPPDSLRARLKREPKRTVAGPANPPGGWGRCFKALGVARLPLQDNDKVNQAASAACNAFDAGQLARNALVSLPTLRQR